MSKKIIIIAGPKGEGKTTFAPETAAFKAGRLMLVEIADCVANGESFAFETTLAGLSYQAHIF